MRGEGRRGNTRLCVPTALHAEPPWTSIPSSSVFCWSFWPETVSRRLPSHTLEELLKFSQTHTLLSPARCLIRLSERNLAAGVTGKSSVSVSFHSEGRYKWLSNKTPGFSNDMIFLFIFLKLQTAKQLKVNVADSQTEAVRFTRICG